MGHNHIYSASYVAGTGLAANIPSGTYVGFEDLPFPNSDFNYTDETYVFAGVRASNAVPEPTTVALFSAGLLGFGVLRRFRLKK